MGKFSYLTRAGDLAESRRGISEWVTFSRMTLGGLSAAALLVLAGPVPAQEAPAPDWTLNVSDDGFDPTPINGTVVYTVTVENDGDRRTPENTLIFQIPFGA